MIDAEAILNEIRAALPNVEAELVANPSPSGQTSLLVAGNDLFAVAEWLKAQPQYCFDYLSNVTGIDRLDEVVKEKVKTTEVVDGEKVEKVETIERLIPGYLEVVYHLFSISHREGPLVLRVRTEDRNQRVTVPSLTPIWRSAEFQEREVFDLFGIHFDGHPDLRRLLMWDDYEEHPMRKDFVDPDDYEYEPTPHGAVIERNRAHQQAKN